MLESPLLTRIAPHVRPETVHQVVLARGLEASAPLLLAVTPQQLASVADVDLWRQADGYAGEVFDADRFGEWLEALADHDVTGAARMLAAMDPDVVTTGLSAYIRVFDPGTFLPTAQSDDEVVELDPGAEAPLAREIGGYHVRARRTDAWDAVIDLLSELESDQPDAFHAILRSCRALSNSAPEIDGLDDLLDTSSQLEYEAATTRDHRRSAQGYASAAEARAFLKAARRPRARLDQPSPARVLAAAYFRSIEEAAQDPDREAPPHPASIVPETAADAASLAEIRELAEASGLLTARPQGLLAGTVGKAVRRPLLVETMERLREADEAAFQARTADLAYLANILMAGCTLQTKPFTHPQSLDAAVAVCSLGLESRESDDPPEAVLASHDLIDVFADGWRRLSSDVSHHVARALASALADIRSTDPEIEEALEGVRRELVRQCDAGTPWIAREALDPLAMLDAAAWTALLGLLNECPILPAIVPALIEGSKERVSATAFSFIDSRDGIRMVHAFVRRLPEFLTGIP